MTSSSSLFFKIGFFNTLYDWRFLVVLLLVALVAVWYWDRKGREIGPSLYVITGLLFVYAALYFLDMVPHMNWFIPLTDQFVAPILYYQYFVYAALVAVLRGSAGEYDSEIMVL